MKIRDVLIGVGALGLVAFAADVAIRARDSAAAEKLIDVGPSADALIVINDTGKRYDDCEWTVNGAFKVKNELLPGKNFLTWARFNRDDGLEFSYEMGRLNSFRLHCRRPTTLSLYREYPLH